MSNINTFSDTINTHPAKIAIGTLLIISAIVMVILSFEYDSVGKFWLEDNSERNIVFGVAGGSIPLSWVVDKLLQKPSEPPVVHPQHLPFPPGLEDWVDVPESVEEMEPVFDFEFEPGEPCVLPNIDSVQISAQRRAEILDTFKVDGAAKGKIVDNSENTVTVEKRYRELIQDRPFDLCDTLDHSFQLLIQGVAFFATLLKWKHKLHNLFVCKNLTSFQAKLTTIQEGERVALIVPCHVFQIVSKEVERYRRKDHVYNDHIVTIGVEKKGGQMNIYMFEPFHFMVEEKNIHLNEGYPFDREELVLAYIDGARLDPSTTAIYKMNPPPLEKNLNLWRQWNLGCGFFALSDAKYFLRDNNFRERILCEENDLMTLPKSKIPVRGILALPGEYVQSTQSMRALEEIEKRYPEVLRSPYPQTQKTYESNRSKHFVEVNGKVQNKRIDHTLLKYQVGLVQLLPILSDAEIITLIQESLI